MDHRRRLTRRYLKQQDRSSGHNSISILNSERMLSDSLRFLESSLQFEDDEDDLECLFLVLSVLKLYQYTQANLARNFPRNNLIPLHEIHQYTIRNQNKVLFQFNFGRFTQEQAMTVFNLLDMPVQLKTSNDFVFLTESGYLIFLK
jgi:hypothetical protein